VVLAKIGLDGHDVGILLLAKRLQDAGFEIVYLGKRNRPVDVARAVIDEDARVVGISALSGGIGALAAGLIDALDREGVSVPVIAGGIAETEEVTEMTSRGVTAFFGPESSIDEVVAAFEAVVRGPA
jgi:methylmalonyl-CoA mutase cobalamin-binding domain/chain